ncbi:hypothetical protein KEJ15_07435, partial [Candidatus Bathyarchaeota archaeon]|nr:hypothetical protein [Candidatus Bathyarchaeota archaeon]
NVYLGFMKKLVNYAKIIMFTVTFPAVSLCVFFITNYAQVAVHPLVMVPQMSWEATFVGLVGFDTLVVGLGTYVFFKPKWWYVALGGGAAVSGAAVYALYRPVWGQGTLVVSAIGLAVACVLVLGISVYVLARIWIDTLKERKRRKGGETAK